MRGDNIGIWLSSPGSVIESAKETEMESSKMTADSINMCTVVDLNMDLVLGNEVTSLDPLLFKGITNSRGVKRPSSLKAGRTALGFLDLSLISFIIWALIYRMKGEAVTSLNVAIGHRPRGSKSSIKYR